MKTIKILCICLICFALASSAFVLLKVEGAENKYISDMKDKWITYRCFEDKVGQDTSHAGDTITIAEDEYEKGIGMHCMPDDPTYLEINIEGLGYKSFYAYVGVQSYSAQNVFLEWGSIKFSVVVDGVSLATSADLKYNESSELIAVDVTGKKTLRLEMSNLGNYSCDWGVWGEAQLTNLTLEEIHKANQTPVPVTATPYILPTQKPETKDTDKAYVSDLEWGASKSYDEAGVIRDGTTAQEEIYFDSEYFEKGIGMHAVPTGEAFVEINIEGLGFTTFAAYVGIADTLTSHDISMASVEFLVYADDTEVAKSEVKRFGEEPSLLKADITGCKVLKLVILPSSDGISGDWGTWGGAVLAKTDNLEEIFATPKPTETPEPTETPKTTPKVSATPNKNATPTGNTSRQNNNSFGTVITIVLAVVIIAAVVFVIIKMKVRKK